MICFGTIIDTVETDIVSWIYSWIKYIDCELYECGIFDILKRHSDFQFAQTFHSLWIHAAFSQIFASYDSCTVASAL